LSKLAPSLESHTELRLEKNLDAQQS
jgi:hypothetical protein